MRGYILIFNGKRTHTSMTTTTTAKFVAQSSSVVVVAAGESCATIDTHYNAYKHTTTSNSRMGSMQHVNHHHQCMRAE